MKSIINTDRGQRNVAIIFVAVLLLIANVALARSGGLDETRPGGNIKEVPFTPITGFDMYQGELDSLQGAINRINRIKDHLTELELELNALNE